MPAKPKTVKARITVYPRPEILDPQGKAIAGALARLGFDRVLDVRAGKSFEVVVKGKTNAEAELRKMCEELLANTLVEDYSVELLGGDSE
jgi:phosphoribosylformylglycinamidine synthase subunit PurS